MERTNILARTSALSESIETSPTTAKNDNLFRRLSLLLLLLALALVGKVDEVRVIVPIIIDSGHDSPSSNTSGGQEVKLEYSYPISVGLGRLSPSTGITWMSQDLANYTFGTLDSEVARGVVDYRPGSTTIPQVGLSFAHPLSRKWFFFGAVRYAALPDKVRQSPLIEDGVDGESSLLLFFTRGL